MKNMNIKLIAALAMAVLFAVPGANATALTAERNTPSNGDLRSIQIGVYTNTRIFAGAMVAINSSGYAVPAANTSGHVVIGRAESTVDNRTNAEGAGDSGALMINVARGVFGWGNNAGITDADIGAFAYAEDDNTVDDDAPSESIIAGVIVDVTSAYVWVDTFNVARLAGAFTTLSASSTLGVVGVATFTAESVHNGGIDTDYVTVDAAAGVDTKTAGALALGAATATSVTLGASDAGVTALDDLAVTGILKALPGSVTSTNTHNIVVGDVSTILLSAAGQSAVAITNTIAAPTTAGTWAVLLNNGASNTIYITEGTTLDSGGVKALGPEDAMLLFGRTTSAWSAIYHDN